MKNYKFAVENTDEGTRVDSFISGEIDDISRNSVQRLIDEALVFVNENSVKSNYRLKKGDIIDVTIPDPKEIEILPEDIPLDILYEDAELIVINKPKGMVVHPAPGHYTGTLVNALMFHCKNSLSGINDVLRPGIVHRIDKDTSGVIVAAKTNRAHQSLTLQLAEHSITRCYNAIVFNKVKEDEGTIDKPIGRHPFERKKMAVTERKSKRAVTHYKVLERLGKFTYIEARLETGRTHQIRVHMAYIGHPLLGDTVYGSSKQPFNTDGQVLHARVLGFIHPVTGEYMEFCANLPEYFEKLLKKVSKI
ncbi:MAG: RluA family pseudouridine synthase [Lachnospiraceae bacterium]|nr:RluA family pseudouridine synthase [Lachnospiraceae bacterium]